MSKHGEKNLIADDEPHILDTVSAYLKKEGYTVVVAHHGGVIRAYPAADGTVFEFTLSIQDN